ncbi:o-succinylbenzoate synthase [Curtanaerobium respiraculi]|uniref:o-succinylbenzoate synthase n=1 Tax=Curtanaerobium respiraculi TaxID=2949669 RepID=UPI0024B32C5E|nr:o-succinylbenzoate synthase [Curtanaerobium respiraculi]
MEERSLNILESLEACATLRAAEPCFIDATRQYRSVSWERARSCALRLARAWHREGFNRGDRIPIDMANGAALVYAVLAAAYGGFCLVMLNVRLMESEKEDRLRDIAAPQRTVGDGAGAVSHPFTEGDAIAAIRTSSFSSASQEMIFAHACIHDFDDDVPAVVMFTSGTSGKPKAAALTWSNFTGASRASNRVLGVSAHARWQLTLPMYHVGGLQIVVRALLSQTAFILYRAFDPQTILRDGRAYGCTHISVVDKMLQDMLAAPEAAALLPRYKCVLLGGAAPNAAMLRKAQDLGAAVVVSYGMTETCSHIACSPVVGADEGMRLLPGYRAIVLDPDERGFGRLAVAGPGVFGGYLNARADFTADGYFITGDRGKIEDGRLVVAERTGDMFVSGGENVYPEEIRRKLLQIPDVTEAFVFGAEDIRWGRRPIAFVEMAQAAKAPGFDRVLAAEHVAESARARMARIYQPREVYVFDDLPRKGIGKVNRAALLRRYASHIAISRIEVWRIKLPFIHPVKTAKTLLKERESLIIRITDSAGRTGIGEDVAFATDWYLPETISDDMRVIERVLAPELLKHSFWKPEEVSMLFSRLSQTIRHPLACAALESAVWDLYGKMTGRSIRSLIGGRDAVDDGTCLHALPEGWVPGGVVVGIEGVTRMLDKVSQAVDSGYARVKLKVAPGHDVETVRAVRRRFPHLLITVDANQSYTESDLDTLKALDAEGIACIEEPLDPRRPPQVGPRGLHARLTRIQRELSCPIALDESWTTAAELESVLEAYPDLRCVVVKVAKFGGIGPALDFCSQARGRGIDFWLGGMFETGVGKRLAGAFAALPGATLPGDINPTSGYFPMDICLPPFDLTDGSLEVNPTGYEAGLGCELDEETLERVAFTHQVFERRS